MRKRLLEIISIKIFILVFISLSHAQVWCPQGATWYYTSGAFQYNGYTKLTYAKDTVIKSIACKKISNYYKGYSEVVGLIQGYSIPFFTYSENGIAYLYNNRYGNERFDVLFDINAPVNAAWRLPLIDTACADSLYFVKVINKGIKKIKNTDLKWLYVKVGPIPNNSNFPYYKFDTITERFGYRFDDLDFLICSNKVAEIPHGSLRCYSDNAFGTYHNTAEARTCDFLYTDISESIKSKSILELYPNPANEQLMLNVRSNPGKIMRLDIYDPIGKLILSKLLNALGGITELSTGDLRQGIYIYKMYVNDQQVESGKLQVVH